MSLELIFIFGKRKGLSLQRRILPTQGEVESLYQTGVDILRSDLRGITVNDTFGHGNDSAPVSLFDHLGIAKIRIGLSVRRSGTASLAGRRIGNAHMITFKQSYPVGIQSITYEQRQLSTKHVCSSVDELIRTLLGAGAHNHSQDNSVF